MQDGRGEGRGRRGGGVRDSMGGRDGGRKMEHKRDTAKETLMNADNKKPNLSSEPPETERFLTGVNKSTGPCLHWFALRAPT